jgi:hypothetical protein
MQTESSLRNCGLKNKQDGVLDKYRTMDNVQKHNTRVLKKVLSHILFSEYIYSKWLKFGGNIN